MSAPRIQATNGGAGTDLLASVEAAGQQVSTARGAEATSNGGTEAISEAASVAGETSSPHSPFHHKRSQSLPSIIRGFMSQPFTRRQAPSAGSQSRAPVEPLPQKPRLSSFSSPAAPDSGWSSQNFMLGAGMVIFQPSTHRIVVLYDTVGKYWFFPRGRKDVGESLETTAIREAYEEVDIFYAYSRHLNCYSQGIESSFSPF